MVSLLFHLFFSYIFLLFPFFFFCCVVSFVCFVRLFFLTVYNVEVYLKTVNLALMPPLSVDGAYGACRTARFCSNQMSPSLSATDRSAADDASTMSWVDYEPLPPVSIRSRLLRRCAGAARRISLARARARTVRAITKPHFRVDRRPTMI